MRTKIVMVLHRPFISVSLASLNYLVAQPCNFSTKRPEDGATIMSTVCPVDSIRNQLSPIRSNKTETDGFIVTYELIIYSPRKSLLKKSI